VGLALRGWVPLIRLNLLPKNLRRRVEPGWWRLAEAIDRSIQRVASLVGEVCVLTERFYYENGLGDARAFS
jgi:hypothetical protein